MLEVVTILVVLLVIASNALAGQPVEANVSVCFTPGERCEGRIVDAIDHARSSIRVQAYGFTSLSIIHALQRASARGVEVLAILDKTNERKYSGATLLEAATTPVWIDFEPAIAHGCAAFGGLRFLKLGLATGPDLIAPGDEGPRRRCPCRCTVRHRRQVSRHHETASIA
ncbi:hypothetical protein HGP16_27080 [Rhizobium sp. P40RR-XXII]|uniref:phospholipase D-like domain-containing protein n=1 Tax=unclassified Rhizobium TaxID=2613769 RepID=UPI001456FD55|nr:MULTISPECIES: phospholipase D-like domain-containing protein [unclassified Rhizobium]NLR88747.1 hypothetical protein [Rhizobium sp. P28RR-XV]NLS20202.1 hypothetical protein [Rhizobium sp. P40RR-XXII]